MAMSASSIDLAHTTVFVGNTQTVYMNQVIAYPVLQPMRNYAQGEVDCHDNWMGGGSGENSRLIGREAVRIGIYGQS
jgi:hypothetical protein